MAFAIARSIGVWIFVIICFELGYLFVDRLDVLNFGKRTMVRVFWLVAAVAMVLGHDSETLMRPLTLIPFVMAGVIHMLLNGVTDMDFRDDS